MSEADLAAIFAHDGVLARKVEGYKFRASQMEMASAVTQAIAKQEVLIAEAGTGTGKTFAYLIPALLSGGKVIVSTGTKTLQDQLFNRDIPQLRAALNVAVSVALLKGRANYVCHYHLERSLSDGRFTAREDTRYLQKIVPFARSSKSGDKSELADVPENASVWSHVTSTRENCLGQDCPRHKDCFVMEARKQAQSADIVVVNHHLFFADVVLREEGAAELLPACNTVIFDEAHQLPETASIFFGESVSSAQIIELARDTQTESAAGAKDFAALPESAAAADKAARDLRLCVERSEGRIPLPALEQEAGFWAALDNIETKLAALGVLLQAQAERSEGLQNCNARCASLLARIRQWRDSSDTTLVRWVEVFLNSLQLQATPLSVAEPFQKQLHAALRAWIFTSATLSVKGDFTHYQEQMGLGSASSMGWESPFDFANQAILYVPSGIPEPNTPDYTRAVIEAVFPVLQASRGRAFCLFTSLRAMNQAYELLHQKFSAHGLDYPLLVQGQGARSELLERFRRLGNAVLLGSQSFWEGVDVKGEALSLVMIDKLPFAPPDDPVLAARIAQISRQGRNAFMEYQLPHAVIALKQGAGRLIRDENDSGVLMICDPRLLSKPYGKTIWRSLPPMRRTRELSDVESFFTRLAGKGADSALQAI
jgi:ATP-dependent DNA helicase DinG